MKISSIVRDDPLTATYILGILSALLLFALVLVSFALMFVIQSNILTVMFSTLLYVLGFALVVLSVPVCPWSVVRAMRMFKQQRSRAGYAYLVVVLFSAALIGCGVWSALFILTTWASGPYPTSS